MATLFFIIIAFFLLCHSGKFALNFFEIFLIFTGQGRKREREEDKVVHKRIYLSIAKLENFFIQKG